MQIKKIKARPINGENGIYVKTGGATFSFEGTVEEPNGKRARYMFIVEGVRGCYSALMTVDFNYCGYFDRDSVTNIRRNSL